MRLLIDCDVLLDVGSEREPHFAASAELLDWAEQHPGQCALAWHSIANVAYLAGRQAISLIEEISSFLEVAETNSQSLDFALQLPMNDFEDAMQVAAAHAFGAQLIVTRNLKHYRKSPIRALTPLEVMKLM